MPYRNLAILLLMLLLPQAAGAATFGVTVNNAGVQTFSADRMYASIASPATSGTITQGTCRVWVSAASSPGARVALYSSVAGEPDAPLALSDETIVSNTSEQAVNFNFTGSNQVAITSGTSYWIAIVFDDPGTPNFTISRANNASVVRFKGITYPTTPNPFAADGSSNGPLDCYITYTEGVAPSIVSASLYLRDAITYVRNGAYYRRD